MPRRKIPTKAELIQLQKLYKTDEKIAERLGNVTPQLVAYWRRKKNIPKHSFPKFSDAEIRELWERFGDDYRCGLELGISKAAFYNWRRRYGLKDKPAFLKLEQLELNLGGPKKLIGKKYHYGQRTIAQKIFAERAGVERVEEGEFVEVEPDLAMSHLNAADVIEKFQAFGLNYVWNPNRIVIPLDCRVTDCSNHDSGLQKAIREFVKRQNIKHFYDFREGGCHQIVVERGHVLPGQLALGTDVETTAYGAVGALAAGIDTQEMASVWALGKIWIRVPTTVKIMINGRMPRGVFAMDVGLFIAKKLTSAGAAYRSIEFNGTAMTQMSISERMTLTGMARAMGTKAAVCPFDTTTRRFFVGRTKMPYRPSLADKDASYSDTYEFNIDSLVPKIACPGRADNVRPVAEVEGTSLDKIIIGSTNSGRFDDLRLMADILKGNQVHPDVQLIVFPGSRSIYLEALKKGLIRAFVEAGVVVMNPQSGPGPNDQQCLLGDGERCLATFCDNRPGALGSEKAEIYLASPATAAASAISGVITDPTRFVG